jgi:hypothetical protein
MADNMWQCLVGVNSAQFLQLTGHQKIIRKDQCTIGFLKYLQLNTQDNTCGIAARRDNCQ